MRNHGRNGELTVCLGHCLESSTDSPADLKYDNCGIPSDWTDEYTYCVPGLSDAKDYPNGTCPDNDNPAPEGYDWSNSKTFERYRRMRDALQNVDRPILFSLCDWGEADVNSWGKEMGASWRMSLDITGASLLPVLCTTEYSDNCRFLVDNRRDCQHEHLYDELRGILGPHRSGYVGGRERRSDNGREQGPFRSLGDHEVSSNAWNCCKLTRPHGIIINLTL